VVLYGEPHPNSKEITEAVQSDLRAHPDLVLVVGTKLKAPGARSIAARSCQAGGSAGGATFLTVKRSQCRE
jgi:NAD-dependent histone deacetylase SIR2